MFGPMKEPSEELGFVPTEMGAVVTVLVAVLMTEDVVAPKVRHKNKLAIRELRTTPNGLVPTGIGGPPRCPCWC